MLYVRLTADKVFLGAVLTRTPSIQSDCYKSFFHCLNQPMINSFIRICQTYMYILLLINFLILFDFRSLDYNIFGAFFD